MVTGEFEESTIPLLWAQFPWREVRHHADQSHSARWEADKAFGFTVQPLPALPLIMTTIQDIRQQLQNIGASTPERLSLASFPWLHREIESCTLDPEKSAANVAAAIEMQGNTKIVDKLLHYFKSIKDFDVKACRGASADFVGRQHKAKVAFDLLGLQKSENPPAKPGQLETAWAVNKATAMGVADLIRWVVNLDEVAPMVLPLPLAKIVKVARDSELMEDWVLALRNTRDDLTHRLVYEEPDPTSTTHVKQSRGVVLLKSAKSQSKNAARCNLELFVYALQAQLMGDPWMKRETVEELVRTFSEKQDGWTEIDIANAVDELNMTQLCATLLFALAYHPAAILSRVGIADKPPVNYLRMWLTRGNLLRAALGLIRTLDIPRLFFETPYVKEFLDNADTVTVSVREALYRPESSLHTIADQIPKGFEENSASAALCSAESPRLGDKRARLETDGYVEDNGRKSKKSKLDSGADSGERHAAGDGNEGRGGEEACPKRMTRWTEAGKDGGEEGGADDVELLPDEQIDWFIDDCRTPPFEPDDDAEEVEETQDADEQATQPLASGFHWTDEEIDWFIDDQEALTWTDEDIDRYLEDIDRYLDASSTWMDDIWDLEISADKNEEPVSVPDEVKDEEPLSPLSELSELSEPADDGEPELSEPDDDEEPELVDNGDKDEAPGVQDTEQQEDEDDEDDDEDEEEGVVAWLNVTPDLPPAPLRDCEALQQEVADGLRITIDRHLLYPLAPRTLEIEHWEVQAHEDGKLTFSAAKHHCRPFQATASDMTALEKMINSEPRAACATYVTDSNPKGMVPLHVHPDAQKYPFGPDAVPGPGVSGIYVVHEANWKKMTAGEIQEACRGRSALVVSPEPYNEDGKQFAFDRESFAAFTRTDRWAYVHDLGRKKSRSDDTLSAGKPVDLIYCREQREAREEVGDMAEGQAFNILSNRTPGLTAKPPPKDMASHEALLHYIYEDPELPAYQFPWEEFNWVILANRDAMTWCHNDVLFTVVTMPYGKKLWFIARRKSNLAPGDFRGNMRSRQAFKGFNGNTDMTQVFDWEMLTLTPYTTLYMAAATVHAVRSIDDCIGVGSHFLNRVLDKAVLVTFHNIMASRITTNADHEPVRRVLLRMFIATCLCLTHRGGDEDKEPIPKRYLDHLPNLYTPPGCDSYPYIFRDGKDKLLPINPDVWAEVQYAWELAMQLENMVHTGWDIVITKPCPGIEHLDFHRIADSVAVHTAVSLVKYHAETARALGKERPDGFTTGAFKYQLRQMLGRFDLHRRSSWHKSYGYPKATHSRNGPTNEKAFSEIRVVDSFDKACNDDSKAHIMLFPWEEGNVPFKLVQKTGS
ncbi:hypothetical protein B0H14DRAFT_2584763 [Mycena olivaceomarginata]|nr:hypothetical protein B0H14DRAFT_2584763 [Mycena olivaceomarginata]